MKKGNVYIKGWDEIQDDFNRMSSMSCRPTFSKMKVGTIIDEDKSVKWNRETVEENNRRYADEVARLNTLKNKARDDVYADIYAKIQDEIPGISLDAAKKIFEYAYDKGHSNGFYEIRYELIELIELIQFVIKGVK